jgi:acyl-CoA thioester hydrolase
MTAEPDLTDRATFQYWYQEKLRFSDTDMIGHINNVAFAAVIESGRVNYTRSGVIQNLPDDVLVVMRRIELDYRAELHWPAEVDVGSVLLRIGRTSITIGNAVFDGGLCAATAVTTLVVIRRDSRKPEPIAEAVRVGMQAFLPRHNDT